MTSWPGVIVRNKKLLLPIIAVMVAAVSYTGADGLLPWRTYRSVRRKVRALEAAVRRLIVIAARDLADRVPQPKNAPAPDFAWVKNLGTLGTVETSPVDTSERVPLFPLIDPRKTFRLSSPSTPSGRTGRRLPRVGVAGFGAAVEPLAPPNPRGFNTAKLRRRLVAIEHALDDIPRQAKRLARVRGRRSIMPPGPRKVGPLRPGLPPGLHRHGREEIDDLLVEIDTMTKIALTGVD